MSKDLMARANNFIERNEILDSKIIIDSKNQVITITGEQEGTIIAAEIKVALSGNIRNTSQFEKAKKSDYQEDIVEL